ncbi:MAG: class I SAM-dependent methyltransferase [Chloroflexi bacterium]|nr:MAG: class I SAM-dependent methyltransferase [Chloroflexota bacterium]
MMQDWESYWKTVVEKGEENRIFWDTSPELAALEDLDRFKSFMNPDLPLLDLGCGTGKQTRFLARHFPHVVGVDISSSVIQLAQEESEGVTNVEFMVLDAVKAEEAAAFHRIFGDVNIYMRGVLQTIKERDRRIFVSNLETLLGEKGVLYQIELPTKAFYYLREMPEEMWSAIPKVLRRVGFNLEDRTDYFPDDRWNVLNEGDNVTMHTVEFQGSANGGLPANFLVLKPK